jgi:ferredoxin
MGSGTGGRGGSRRAGLGAGRGGGCACGKGQGRGAGATGLLSSALGLVGQLIPPKTTRIPDVASIQSARGRKTGASLTAGRVVPINKRSRDQQSRNVASLASVNIEKCTGCGICAQICPAGAILVNGAASVDAGRCTGCGLCVAECPQDALVLGKA